jgi:hypothetical protein
VALPARAIRSQPVGLPANAGATIIPVAIGPEDLGQAVHTVALFPGTVQAGMAAAQQLAAKLRAGGLNAFFDQRKFGRVHPEVVAEPYLVSPPVGALGALARWLLDWRSVPCCLPWCLLCHTHSNIPGLATPRGLPPLRSLTHRGTAFRPCRAATLWE